MSIAPSSPSSIPVSTGTRRLSGHSALPALALLTVLLASPAPAGAAIVEEMVAKINNRIVTKSEFEERGNYILKQIYQEFSGSELDRELVEAQESMLANMITELLLIDRAESLLDLTKVRKNLVDDFRKQQNIASDEDLEKLLKDQGMTRHDLEEQLIRLAVPQEIISYEVRRKISVSEPEIRKYYEDHQATWETAPTVTFNEIVLFYEEANKAEVLSRAQGIVREAKGGADFGDLVQHYSEAASKESGGFLGPFPATDLHTAIAQAAFALEPGAIADPIDTGRSFHVIRLIGKTERLVKSIDEARDAIVHGVREAKFRPRYNAYIRKLWKDNQIEISPKYEHFLVRSPLKQGEGVQAPAPIGGKEEAAPPETPGDAG